MPCFSASSRIAMSTTADFFTFSFFASAFRKLRTVSSWRYEANLRPFGFGPGFCFGADSFFSTKRKYIA